jgi:hypothetical protein
MSKIPFYSIISAILIPIIVAIENWRFRQKTQNKEDNRFIYNGKFSKSFESLFPSKLNPVNNASSNDSEVTTYPSDFFTYNISQLHELFSDIINFHESANKFKSYRVRRLFNKLYPIAKRLIIIDTKNFKYCNIENLEGSFNFYLDYKDDLLLFKIKFKTFYKSVFNYT